MAAFHIHSWQYCLEDEEEEITMSILGKPAVHIQRSVYTMATTDGTKAEIIMYGDIYEQQPIDWWTGKPVEGQFILLSDFLTDLEQIAGCKEITIRMNSYGGDAGVSNTIHNRLRDLARNGAKLTCVVDGVAMSGGSLIMCACDTVQVNPSSLIMIHKCWTYIWGSYNADELRQMAEQNDAWDKMQVSIYKRKTGLSDTVISHMMADTTYMTGREAVEKGFADEVLDDAEPLNIAASADGRCLFVRGRKLPLSMGAFAPDHIPTVTSEETSVETNTNTPVVTGSNEGGNSMTEQELRAQYPDIVEQVEANARAAANTAAINAAVQAERDRIQAIDEVACLYSEEMVSEAKYGDKACTVQELTYRAAKAAAAKGGQVLKDLEEDTGASGAGDVGAAAPPAQEGGDEITVEHARAAAKQFNDRKKEAR